MSNPILTKKEPTAALELIQSPCVIKKKRNAKRELRDARRALSAEAAIGGWDFETEIFGFTKGAFSVIDIITHLLGLTGPAHVVFSTWTAAKTDVTAVLEMVKSGKMLTSRWLVDLTFQRRSPELAHEIRRVFGKDAIRVAKNHAKFALIGTERRKIVLRTSMNINYNPRFEDFTIADDPELYGFIMRIVDEVWKRQPVEMASNTPHEIEKHFNKDL
jgi:hypothetical protein